MTWEIVLGIIALASFLFTLCGIVFKAAKVLTSLEATVKELSASLKDSKNDRKSLHDKVDDHEKRIYTLEIKAE